MLRALIVGGDLSANYVIKSFKQNHIDIVVLNEKKDVCEYLSKQNHIGVYCSPTNKLYSYNELKINNFDLVVALENDDVRNYIIVSLAKKFFHVKRAICTVKNPENVKIFKALGIDTPICNSHLLAQQILNDSDIESVMKTLSLENDQIMITEITLRPSYLITNKLIMDIAFPETANISCIYRAPKVIIPKGNTKLLAGDRLVICCTSKTKNRVINFIKKE